MLHLQLAWRIPQVFGEYGRSIDRIQLYFYQIFVPVREYLIRRHTYPEGRIVDLFLVCLSSAEELPLFPDPIARRYDPIPLP